MAEASLPPKETQPKEQFLPKQQEQAKIQALPAAPEKPTRRRAKKVQQLSSVAPAQATNERGLLFGKYSYEVVVNDPSLRNYINLKPAEFPHSFRRTSSKMFSKAEINIVERLENSLMRGGTGGKIGAKVIRTKGRLQGKKMKVMHIIEKAFEIVNTKTNKNPLQMLINALENSAPIEDVTRIRQGGTIASISVDVSASRRLDIALKNMAIASITGAFKKKKRIAEALADELILAANRDVNSYAIKRKNEIERMARSAK